MEDNLEFRRRVSKHSEFGSVFQKFPKSRGIVSYVTLVHAGHLPWQRYHILTVYERMDITSDKVNHGNQPMWDIFNFLSDILCIWRIDLGKEKVVINPMTFDWNLKFMGGGSQILNFFHFAPIFQME